VGLQVECAIERDLSAATSFITKTMPLTREATGLRTFLLFRNMKEKGDKALSRILKKS
jgi:hypothetical protein